jgi:hypothetical protein
VPFGQDADGLFDPDPRGQGVLELPDGCAQLVSLGRGRIV